MSISRRSLLLFSVPMLHSTLVGAQLLAQDEKVSHAEQVERLVAVLVTGDTAGAHKAERELRQLCEHVMRPGADSERREVAKSFARAVAQTDSVEVRLVLIRNIQRVGKWEIVSMLGKILSDPEADPKLREAARSALEANPAVGAKKELRRALVTTSGELKVAVIHSLGVRQDPLSAGVLMDTADDPDPAVQLAAIEALAAIGEISAVAVVEAALESYQGERLEAARRAYVRYADSLVRNNEKGQARRIYHRAIDMGPAYEAPALIGLAKAGLQSEVDRIVRATQSPEPSVQSAALEAAALLEGPRMTQAVVDHLKHVTVEKRRLALLEVLAKRKDPAARAALEKALLAAREPELAPTILLLKRSYARHTAGDAALPPEVAGFLLDCLDKNEQTAAAAEDFLSTVESPGFTASLKSMAPSSEGQREVLKRILAQREARSSKEKADADSGPAESRG